MIPRNRRLVPMPPNKPRGRKEKAQPVAATIAPSGLKTWQTFAFLVVIAIVWHYFRPLLIVAGMFAGFFIGLNWLCHRFPRTGYFVLVIVRELLRSGRRRR